MHKNSPQYSRLEFTLSEEDRRSIPSLVPDSVARQIQNLLHGDNSHLLVLSERALLKEMARKGLSPGARDHAIRMRFWVEFEAIQSSVAKSQQMCMARIIGKDISKEAFYKHYITTPHYLAYILCPPENYLMLLEQGLTVSMYRLLEWVEKTDLNDDNVLKASKVLEELHKRWVSIRFRGQARQKIEEPTGAPEETPPTAIDPNALKALREKHAET